MNDEPRFWQPHWNDTQTEGVLASLHSHELIAIVDEEAGGIIGYAIGQNAADQITDSLNQTHTNKENL